MVVWWRAQDERLTGSQCVPAVRADEAVLVEHVERGPLDAVRRLQGLLALLADRWHDGEQTWGWLVALEQPARELRS